MTKQEERELEDKFFDLLFKSKELFDEEKNDEAWEVMISIFDIFPEPKYEYRLLYLLLTEIVQYALKTKRYDIGKKYISLLFISDVDRADDGSRESYAGKIEYELGNMETAKQLLKLAYSKRIGVNYFQGKENEKYLKLAKEK